MGFVSNLQALKNDGHKSSSNRHKKMSYINNIMGHHGLFIYFDTRCLGSFHDVNIMCESNLYKNSCQFKLYVGMNALSIFIEGPKLYGQEGILMWWFRCHNPNLGLTMKIKAKQRKVRLDQVKAKQSCTTLGEWKGALLGLSRLTPIWELGILERPKFLWQKCKGKSYANQ